MKNTLGVVALTIVVAFLVAASTASQAVRTDKLVILNDDGMAIIVAQADESGGAQVVIRDAAGQVVLTFKNGKIETNSRDRAPKPPSRRSTKPAADTAKLDNIALRGSVDASKKDILLAKQVVLRGWVYVMPSPKSKQARWGNSDGRTTWYNGYWTNSKTNKTSSVVPSPSNDYAGDGKGSGGWRRGGSPSRPTMIEWLCSK